MKIRWFLLILMLGIGITAYFTFPNSTEEKPPHKPKHAKEIIGTYFFPMPISKFTSAHLPCLPVRINNRVISSMLDLGFRGDFDFTSTAASEIQDKEFIGEKNMYGFRGKVYKKKIFRIPKVNIGKVSFSHSLMQEAAEEAENDASLLEEKNAKPTPREPGQIGWQLFQNINLLLDLGNSQIAFCDSAETLAKHGYPTELFVKIPLLTERGLIEFEAFTAKGSLLCSLDTGCTWNILNRENDQENSIEEIAFDPNNLSQITLKISETDFGPIQFHHLPINLPIKVEALLGMEFFKTHQVFLDFAEHQIYIRPIEIKTIPLDEEKSVHKNAAATVSSLPQI